ncbi:helix-turn-helix transcriptional regulator [Azorhizobium doebereinerae]|uniref:helix-turn-helix transcriptional regulator n=1 Tax=Azorhizobium doebereinerae TaxID=281091 RepID=UPI0004185F1A|nr:YafY family protein [Azorhizobium doebereinerae]
MSRTERLLALLQLLRRHRRPVSGRTLAADLSISLRTLYRDIATLQAQGAHIEGEPGVGYVLRPGFLLPPLMFSVEEIEALVLGTRWVTQRSDDHLASAARNAIAKIAAVLPGDLLEELEASSLLVGPAAAQAGPDLPAIRAAIRAEQKVRIAYEAGDGVATDRVIWPFALAFFDHARVVLAWCELRQGFRHFRVDRISAFDQTGQRYPRRRQTLLRHWRTAEGIPPRP